MEDEYVVKRIVEGTAKSNADIENICNIMCGQAFNERYFGSVAAVVEIVNGVVTKQRLNWPPENDPNFNRAQQKSADTLLAAAVKALQAGVGAGNGDIKVKVVAKA